MEGVEYIALTEPFWEGGKKKIFDSQTHDFQHMPHQCSRQDFFDKVGGGDVGCNYLWLIIRNCCYQRLSIISVLINSCLAKKLHKVYTHACQIYELKVRLPDIECEARSQHHSKT